MLPIPTIRIYKETPLSMEDELDLRKASSYSDYLLKKSKTVKETSSHPHISPQPHQSFLKNLSGPQLDMGQTLGGYKVESRLGSGAFASVWLVSKQDQLYALKLVDRLDHKKLSALKKEESILKSLDSPLIVQYIDSIVTPTLYGLVLEYVPSQDMFDYIMDHHTIIQGDSLGIPELEAKRLFHQLLLSLEYLHGQGYSHGDLKLENILVGNSLKLIDFGFSQPTQEPLKLHHGSEPYLCPEMVMRLPTDTCKADVWASGVVLFCLLTSRMPFDASSSFLESPMKTFHRIARVAYSFTELEMQVLSPEARQVVARAFTRDPNKRPTPSELLSDPWFKSP